MFNIEPVPAEFRKKIEEELAQNGPAALYSELKEKDPNSKYILMITTGLFVLLKLSDIQVGSRVS